MNKKQLLILIGVLVILIDQWLKIWVKTHMEYGQQISMFGLDWAYLHFVENNGMAFGLDLAGGDWGKYVLVSFRILLVVGLFYYLRVLLNTQAAMSALVSIVLILAGAVGNIIDGVFYGIIFSKSPFHGGVATIFPGDDHYAGWFNGMVVDMLYFPIISGEFPSWMPFWGGESFLFNSMIFNLADLAITVGVICFLLLPHKAKHPEAVPAAPADEPEAPMQEPLENLPEENSDTTAA